MNRGEGTPRISRSDFLKLMGFLTTIGGFGGFLDLFGKRSPCSNSSPQIASAQTGGGGSWAIVGQTSAPAIHACLLRTGNIFYIAGSGYGPLYPAGTYKAKVINPNTSAETDVPLPEDLFCSGQTHLANGNILLSGGTLLYDSDISNCNGKWHGLASAYEYNVGSGSLVKVSSMAHGRWYPTHLTAPDGKVFVINGLDEYGVPNRLVEVYDPSSKTFSIKFDPGSSTTYCVGAGQTSCTGAGSPCYGATNQGVTPFVSYYPRMHLMPSGLFIVAGMTQPVRSLDPATGRWAFIRNMDQARQYGSTFLLPLQNTSSERGKILVVGGSNTAEDRSYCKCHNVRFQSGYLNKPSFTNSRIHNKCKEICSSSYLT